MTTAYTSLLGLALPVTGELSGTWGDTVNTAITSLLDTAIAGTTSITTDADITLSTTTGASNQARQAIILWNPASGTVTRNITAPAQSKLYVVINASGGTQSIVIRGAGPTTGVTIAKGESATVAWNGSDFVKVSSSGGAITFTDLTVTGNTILGDAAADTLTVNATSTFASPVSFQGLVRLPSTGRSAAAALTVTAPAFLYGVASTYTDTTSSGTIAAMAPFYSLAQPTLSTSNVTTYTSAATLYIANAPAAGGSATITNPYSLYIAAGNMYFGGSVASNLLFVDNTYDIGASGATRPRSIFVGTNVTAANNITAVNQVIAAFGTYGSFASPAIMIGDASYGFYVAGGNLLVKSASAGAFTLLNTAGSSPAVSLDVAGNVALTTVSTLSGSATNGMLAFSTTNLQHGLGSAWTVQSSYIGGSLATRLDSTGFAVGGVNASTTLEAYKEVAFGQPANSVIRASSRDNYGSSLFGYGFYVASNLDEIARIAASYPDSSGFGRGTLFFQVGDPTNGVVTRAILDSYNNFTAGVNVEAHYGVVNNAQITAVSTSDNNGIAINYPPAPGGSAGGALNFWNADNTSSKNQGRIKLVCTDGATGAFGSDMIFYNAIAGSLTEWLRSDRFGVISSSKKLLMGSTNGTFNGAGVKIYAGSGLGSESGTIVVGTGDTNVPALLLTNWDGAATSYGPSIGIDNSGWGAIRFGGANGANRFDIAEGSVYGSSSWMSINNVNGYTGFGTLNPSYRITTSSSATNGGDILLEKTNSGTANQGAHSIRFWNYGPANTGRNDNVALGEIYFGASQPTSGAIQDAAQIIVRADGSQQGTGTASKMQFLTTTTSGGNGIAQVLYGDRTATFGTDSKGGGRITAYQSGTNSYVCATYDGDNSSNFGMSWYIVGQQHTIARIKGYYESSGGTGQGGITLQTKVVAGALRDVFNARPEGTIIFSLYGAGTLSTNSGGEISASDGRFKTKTRGLSDALSKVRQLAGLSTYYRWNVDSPWGATNHEEEIGWVAQDVATVIPEASPEPTDPEKFRNYHDRAILAYLTKALDDLASQFEAYKATHP